MGYNLHIEARQDGMRAPIELARWLEAASTTPGIRLAASGATATDPLSGGRVTVPHQEGDVEVYFDDDDVWHVVFLWTGDSAMFRAAGDFEDGDGPVRRAARALADRLGAVVVGDEGELY